MTPLPEVRRAWQRARGFFTDNPLLDVAVTAGAVGVYWRAEVRFGGDPLAVLDVDPYRSAVQGLAAMGAALLGLTITAMAIVLAITPGDRLRVLLRHHRATIVTSFVGAGRALAALTGIATYLLLFQADGIVPEWLRLAAYATLLLSALGITRLIYVLNYLLRIGTIDKDERTEGNGQSRPGRQFRNVW